MMVASMMVPSESFSPFSLRWALTSLKDTLVEVVGLEKMAEFIDGNPPGTGSFPRSIPTKRSSEIRQVGEGSSAPGLCG